MATDENSDFNISLYTRCKKEESNKGAVVRNKHIS